MFLNTHISTAATAQELEQGCSGGWTNITVVAEVLVVVLFA